MKTRILSIFIVFIMAISVITPGVYAEGTDSLSTKYAENNEFLKAVGVYESDFAENGTTVLSRGDFLHYAFRLLNYELKEPVGPSPFWDLDSEYKHYDSVYNAYMYGILKGYSDGSVGVYKSITVEESIGILLRILGYDSFINEAYDYQTGVFNLAYSLKLVDDLSLEAELTYSDMSALLKRVLKTPLMGQIMYGETQYFDNSNGATLLDQNFDIYHIEGIVEADQISSINRGVESNPRGIKISDKYINMVYSGDRYLGYNVECWYRDVDDTREVVYIKPKDNNVITISDVQYDTISDKEISYYVNGNKKLVRIGKTTSYIYNGKKIDYATEFSKDLFDLNEGTIVAVDNNVDGITDVIYINNYYNLIVKNYSPAENVILGHNKKFIDFEDEDLIYNIKDVYNKKVEASSLKEYDVLSVLESTDKKYMDIIVSYSHITAECEQLSKANSYHEVVIKGETYEIAPDYYAANDISHYLGSPAVFVINSFNRVAAVYNEKAFGSDNFGLLVYAAKGRGLSGAQDCKIYILNNLDNEYETLTLNSRVKVDGGTPIDADDAVDALWVGAAKNGRLIGTFIRYGLNEEGLVTFIDTPQERENGTEESEEEDLSLVTVWTPEDGQLNYKGYGYFAVNYYMGSDTKFYLLPSDKDMENGIYECECYDELPNDYKPKPYIYTLGDNTAIMKGVVIKKDNDSASLGSEVDEVSHLFVVDGILDALDSKGYEIKLLKVVSETGVIEIPVEEEQESLLDGLSRGDVIRYKMSLSGKLTAVQKLFDYSDKKPVLGNNVINGHNQIRIGVACDLLDDMYLKTAMIDKSNIGTIDTLSRSDFVNIDIQKSHVFKVERNNILFEPSSVSNIKTSEVYKTGADIVISVMRYNQRVDMLILSE